MANENCCYDCVCCIPNNAPIECGVGYICINPNGEHYLENRIDQWAKPCRYFIGGKEDGK